MTVLDQLAMSSIAERQSLRGGTRRVHRLAFVDACTEERMLRLLAVLEAARIGHGNDVDDHDCPLCIAVHACDRDPLLSTNGLFDERGEG